MSIEPDDGEEREEFSISTVNATKLNDLLHRIKIADPLCERIIVSFSGGGDSGEIEDISADPQSEVVQAILDEAHVNNFINDILCTTGHDWWNNEGGGGSMTIHILSRVIDLDMDLNIQSTESHPMRSHI